MSRHRHEAVEDIKNGSIIVEIDTGAAFMFDAVNGASGTLNYTTVEVFRLNNK